MFSSDKSCQQLLFLIYLLTRGEFKLFFSFLRLMLLFFPFMLNNYLYSGIKKIHLGKNFLEQSKWKETGKCRHFWRSNKMIIYFGKCNHLPNFVSFFSFYDSKSVFRCEGSFSSLCLHSSVRNYSFIELPPARSHNCLPNI